MQAATEQRTTISLSIPNNIYRELVAAARGSGHTIDTYLISTLTIGTRLKLVEGAQRLPNKGTAIDPLLAEAIRRNSEGKPWEHKASLLLATPGLTPTAPLPQQPDPAAIRPLHTHNAQQLMARHGLPIKQPAKGAPYATIDGNPYTWNQTALILAVWEHAGGNWTGRKMRDYASSAGLRDRSVEPVLRQLVEQGWIEQRPHPRPVAQGPHRTARHQRRLNPVIAFELDAGRIHPA